MTHHSTFRRSRNNMILKHNQHSLLETTDHGPTILLGTAHSACLCSVSRQSIARHTRHNVVVDSPFFDKRRQHGLLSKGRSANPTRSVCTGHGGKVWLTGTDRLGRLRSVCRYVSAIDGLLHCYAFTNHLTGYLALHLSVSVPGSMEAASKGTPTEK